MLKLPSSWQKDWQFNQFFSVLDSLEGKIYRNKDGRKTFRYTLESQSCFIKLHNGVGWRYIIKELFRFRVPVISARNEWTAIRRLKQLNIETMNLVGYGCQGRNPARLKSFVITEELLQTVSLEDYCADWQDNPPPPSLKRALIAEVAHIARTLHQNGINHRDFYLCHFLLDHSDNDKKNIAATSPRLFLIDLHRVQMRSRLPQRWRVKDIAGLYFSSMEAGLTSRDIFRFMKAYMAVPLRTALSDNAVFWRQVEKRGWREKRVFAAKWGDTAKEPASGSVP